MELLRDECSVRNAGSLHPMTNAASPTGAHSKPRFTRNSTGFFGQEQKRHKMSRTGAAHNPYQEMVLKLADQ